MHRALLLVLGLLAAPLLMVLTAAPAHACSCASTPFATRVAGADAVFTGTVTAREDPETGPAASSATPITWTVAVDAVHRGEVGASADVVAAAGEASCGLAFTVGERYVVVGTSRIGGGVDTGLCTGTAPFSTLAAADVAALGAGTPVPAPVAAPAPAIAVSAAPIGSLVVGGTAVLVLVALMVMVVRRRRA